MRFTRLTLEILRAVPFAPLTVDAEILRAGRRVEWVGASLTAGGTELVRATGWRIRQEDGALADVPAPEPPPVPGPDGVPETPTPEFLPEESFGGPATEQRFARGSWGLGPSAVWMRLRSPLVPGEEPSPLQGTAALADFGNGVSAALPWGSHTFVNTDLTIYLDRSPAGPWLLLDAATRLDPSGSGVAESALFDATGRVGRALQSLFASRL
jgi:hypothetical protein